MGLKLYFFQLGILYLLHGGDRRSGALLGDRQGGGDRSILQSLGDVLSLHQGGEEKSGKGVAGSGGIHHRDVIDAMSIGLSLIHI